MLVAKIEIWPHGHQELGKELCRAFIINDGTGTEDVGNYNVRIDMPDATQIRFRVKNFNRNLSPWDLLYRALDKIAEKEKSK